MVEEEDVEAGEEEGDAPPEQYQPRMRETASPGGSCTLPRQDTVDPTKAVRDATVTQSSSLAADGPALCYLFTDGNTLHAGKQP